MNIDDLKGAWGKDESAGMRLQDSGVIAGKTTSVVEKIRRKMRSEFVATLVAYILLIIYIIVINRAFYGTPQAIFFLNVISLLLFTMILLNGYFFSRFYIFYKNTGRYDLGTLESIRKIAYELELNTEIYKAYSISVAPLAALITFTLVGGKSVYDALLHILSSAALTSGGMIWALATIAVAFAITWYFVNLHVRLQYGKYLKELKQVVDDLGSGN